MNGWDDRDRGRRREREDIGVDPLLDRALRMTRELYDVLRQAEKNVDDTVNDLRRAARIERGAERYERKGEAIERRAEGIEREALGDLQGTSERRERGGRY